MSPDQTRLSSVFSKQDCSNVKKDDLDYHYCIWIIILESHGCDDWKFAKQSFTKKSSPRYLIFKSNISLPNVINTPCL